MEHGPRYEEREWKTPHIEAATEPCENHHSRNDDAYFISPDHHLAGVYDGAGGAPGSDVAARLVAQTMFEKLKSLSKHATRDEIQFLMYEVFDEAHNQVKFAQAHDPDHPIMCTTGLVARIWYKDNERRVVIGHVGDSRAYIRHPDSRLEAVTLDEGQLLRKFSTYDGKTVDERAAWQLQNNIDNALSKDELSLAEQKIFSNDERPAQMIGYDTYKIPRVQDFSFPHDSALLLTTDGMRNLTRDQMAAILNQTISNPNAAVNALVGHAKRESSKGGFRSKPDDITALIVT